MFRSDAVARSQLIRRRRRRYLETLIATLLVLWTGAAIYLAFLPDAPAGPLSDEVGHLAVSTMLGIGVFAVFRCWHGPLGRTVLWFLVLSMAALVVELLQPLVGRGTEASDFFAGLGGLAIAALVTLVLFRGSFRWNRNAVGQPSWSALTTVAVLMASGFGVAMLGPVRSSPPVQDWLECDWSQPDAEASRIRLMGRTPAVFVSRSGALLPTEYTASRTSLLRTSALMTNVRCSDEVTVMAWVTSFDPAQEGPARIVSSADGVNLDQQNFHFGQEASALSVRIRTTPNEVEWFLLDDVFSEPGAHHLAARFRRGQLDVFVDGELRRVFATEGGGLGSWSDYPLSIGDEVTDDRAFDGLVSDVELRASWLSDRAIITAAAAAD